MSQPSPVASGQEIRTSLSVSSSPPIMGLRKAQLDSVQGQDSSHECDLK